jgi:hypothetical protein
MPARLTILAIVAGLSACGGDAPPSIDATMPDAGPCLDLNASCAGDVLRTCSGPGAAVEEQLCTWGCNVLGGAPRCNRVVPTGGGVTPDHALPASFEGIRADFSLSGFIDGSVGTINGATAASLQLGFELTNGIGVFRFNTLSIGVVRLVGTAPVALVADGPIAIEAGIIATGLCETSPDIAGAGGGNGGANSGDDGLLIGGGNGAANADGGDGGGAGGGWGGTGGESGGGEHGGVSSGDATIVVLRGGGGGGAGSGTDVQGFRGGGGGGAIQLVSNTRIELVGSGSINAGGCGGKRGRGLDDQGGGGGAGGTIVLEAPSITFAGLANVLAVNGGGGGGGGGGTSEDGGDAKLSREAAAGGRSDNNGGAGGAGAAGATIDGTDGLAGTSVQRRGGGGGAAGRIRIHTRDGTATINGVLSPGLADPQTTATLGIAVVQ